MKKKIIWLVVSCWMAAVLLLASCAPAAVKEEEKKVAPPVKKEEAAPEKKEVVAPKEVVEQPQYGGILTMARSSDLNTGWKFTQDILGPRSLGDWWHLKGAVLGGLLEYDALKGPRGTKQWGTEPVGDPNPGIQAGNLAESWEFDPANDIVKFKMREGIYWQDGAKVTAEDVLYTFHLMYGGLNYKSAWVTTRPYIRDIKNPQKSVYLDPNDPTGRTVVIEAPRGFLGETWILFLSNFNIILPRSLGNRDGFGTWKDAFGNGPYVVTDYVPDSSLTFRRAPNYAYRKFDPFHPENRLPYPDGFRWLVIPDLSTRLAALRTGKVDIMEGIAAEDAESLWKTNPELKWRSTPGTSGPTLAVRHDVAPFGDIRVRRALMMAINHDEMVNSLYGGNANMFYWPTFPGQPLNIYVPIDNMPQDVKELYEYHPDKARQLLAEAGYPDGFAFSVDVSSVDTTGTDALQVLKEYFAKVGVKLNIQIREPAVFRSMYANFTYREAVMASTSSWHSYCWMYVLPGRIYNYARMNDPEINKIAQRQLANFVTDINEWVRVWPEVSVEAQRRVPYILTPSPNQYIFWQPWVKEYYGEQYQQPGPGDFQELGIRGLWIDQKLKKAMKR